MPSRETGYYPIGWSGDTQRMVITTHDEDGAEIEVPAKFVVCPVCEGHGRYVNPAIDGQGISPEEFAEDPDFAEAYFSGQCDVNCAGCSGARVVLTPVHEADLKLMVEAWQSDAMHHAEVEAERRMGA